MKKTTVATSGRSVPPKLMVSREDAEKGIDSQIEQGKKLLGSRMSDQKGGLLGGILTEDGFKVAQREYLKWDNYNIALLRKLFDSNEIAEEYNQSLGFAIGSVESTLGELV